MLKPQIIHAQDLIKVLMEKGVIPPNCTRCVIDLDVADVARLYFECLGDERLIEVFMQENAIVIGEKSPSADPVPST
jgi:hypothetical protein